MNRNGDLPLALVFAILVLGSLTAMSAEPAAPNPVVEGNTAFACELYADLCKSEKGNLFFSPASIHAALAMTYAGARGTTAEQMAGALHYPADPIALSAAYGKLLEQLNTPRLNWQKKPVYELVIANALWSQKGYPFQDTFLALNKQHFRAGLNEVDFAQGSAARKTVNDWVAQQTRDRIKDLIPEGVLNNLTRLVLTNAVYFKSRWAEKFSEGVTREGPFFRLDGTQRAVPLMYQEEEFPYTQDEQLQVLDLPYESYELSMTVILPRKADGLPEIERGVSAERVKTWVSAFRPAQVKVTFPKFRIESRLSVASLLQARGMTAAFQASTADFSGLTKAEAVFISAILHQAFVEVDETGTEAAAATAVAMAAESMPPEDEPKVFKADHPFLFLIRHRKTGAVLFLGRAMDPGAR